MTNNNTISGNDSGGVTNPPISVQVLDAGGSGAAAWKQYDQGTTVGAVFTATYGSADPDAFTFRVNGAPATAATVLSHGARLTIAPAKAKGNSN